MRKIKKSLIVLTSLMLMAATACSDIKADSPADGKYATQNRESSLEYSLYMSKQIQVFINQITSRMGIAKSLSEGNTVDNEYTLANQSLTAMKEAYDELVTVYPSTGSDDERESVILAMGTAIEHMEGYVEAVKNNEDVSGYAEDFKNDFDQLTALSNFYNQ